MKKKRLCILGSTGSVGQTTLDVVRQLKHLFEIHSIAAKSNIEILKKQMEEFSPKYVAVFEEEKARSLRGLFPHLSIASGREGLVEIASMEEVDLVVVAMSGLESLPATLAAIRAKKIIALANKEILVAAGPFIMAEVKKNNTLLLPVDSEHSAIFQCLQKENGGVKRLILTASGGPFYHYPLETLRAVTLKDALCHPTYRMGRKITVDSSTLMNKGLEVIEAHFLFDVPAPQIEVVIHPQSVIHSFVEFVDGALLSQASEPNMFFPIQYALTYPERKRNHLPPFDFKKYPTLEFFTPDKEKFPCLGLAYEALKIKKSMPCFMNAADEILVERFAKGEISWVEIGQKLEKLMSSHREVDLVDLELLQEVDREARREANRI
jgi:1-deoxy-D-xylulose-5-phosphate reductoisomerase